jgi:hypothetical protein
MNEAFFFEQDNRLENEQVILSSLQIGDFEPLNIIV